MALPLPKVIKRQSYNDYTKHADEIPLVLQRLINTKRSDLVTISKETGILYSTISRWHRELAKDIHFNPLDKK